MQPRSRSRRAGFTLIELLTVIAIIGILAAIIIPTVGKVRSSARASHSLSNLRQIAQGFQAYAADNRGMIPAATHAGAESNNPTGGFWHHELTPYVGGRLDLRPNGTIAARNVPASRFFSCPVWAALLGYDPVEQAIATNAEDIRTGYSMNNQLAFVNGLNIGQYSDGSSWKFRTRIDLYKEPSRTVVIAMGHYEGFTVNQAGIEAKAPFAPIGDGGAQVEHFRRLGAGSNGLGGSSGGFGFLDGSVRKLTPAEAAVYLRRRT